MTSANTTRRGRPPQSDERLEARRTQIVEAARDLFAAGGYDGVSMRKVAVRANCQPSALYTLFPSKRRLLHFLWESIFADLHKVLDRSYAENAAKDRLAALCLAQIDFWLARPEDYRAIFLVEDKLEEPGDQYFARSPVIAEYQGVLCRALSEAQTRGEIRAGDVSELKNVLLCCVQGVAYNLIGIPEFPWGDPARIKSIAVHAMIDGLR